MQGIVHYFLHFGFIGIMAILLFHNDWKRAYLILLGTMVVDLDHLLANPIFQSDRISIGYHLLHTYPAMAIYGVMLLLPRPYNIIGVGLLFHMFTDFVDGMYMYIGNESRYLDAPAYELMKLVSRILKEIGFLRG